MSKLIVFTYDDQQKASTVLQKVAELSKEHLIEVQDAAVIVKDDVTTQVPTCHFGNKRS